MGGAVQLLEQELAVLAVQYADPPGLRQQDSGQAQLSAQGRIIGYGPTLKKVAAGKVGRNLR